MTKAGSQLTIHGQSDSALDVILLKAKVTKQRGPDDSKKCSKTGTEDVEKEPGERQAGRHHVWFSAPGGRTVTREHEPGDLPAANPRTSFRVQEDHRAPAWAGPREPRRPADIPADTGLPGHCREASVFSISYMYTSLGLRGRYTVLVNFLFSFLPRTEQQEAPIYTVLYFN